MKPDDITFSPHARCAGKPEVRVRWLGTAGFEIEHDGWVVLIDPYLTRASLGTCLTSALQPDLLAIRRHVTRADAIVCGHTHFDHVLDVPTIARFTGAKVFGSRSAAGLCRAEGLPETQIVDVEAAGRRETEAEVGPFRLRFVPSAHSPLLAGNVPFPGDIADCDQVPLRMQHYRCGAVFGVQIEVAGRSLYHAGSANLDDAQSASQREVDLLIACVAGWTTTQRFVPRLFRAVSPGAILLSHWDNFFRPLSAATWALPALKLPRFVDELSAEGRGVPIGTLPMLGELWL